MTEDEIIERINCIREFANTSDDESAHSAEDALAWTFILYISKDNRVDKDIRDKAKLLLTSLDIEFARWCA